ncbi:MAG: nuclear transport factor 2 family protein [Psychrobium sp.]|nr:nuclear transport factor 2 family protein [Psychrobium sp.]
MKKIIIIILAIFSLSAQAKNTFNTEQLEKTVHTFVQAVVDARQQPKTTITDIDNYIALLADNFIDEHIKYKFTYTDKATLRNDMIAKMGGSIIFSAVKIEQIIVGSNAAFIKMTEIIKGKPKHLDKIVEYTKTNILLLEFNKQGLITHIRRHHS